MARRGPADPEWKSKGAEPEPGLQSLHLSVYIILALPSPAGCVRAERKLLRRLCLCLRPGIIGRRAAEGRRGNKGHGRDGGKTRGAKQGELCTSFKQP